MSKINRSRLRFASFVSILLLSVAPALSQARTNEPTAIDVKETRAVTAFAPKLPGIDDYKKILAENPGDAIAENGLGVLYYSAARYDEAQALIMHAADTRPDIWNFQLNASMMFARQTSYDRALAYAQAAYALAPKETRVREQLCDMYLATQNGAEALECFESLVKDGSDDTDDILGYGEAFILTGDFEHAETTLLDVIKATPRSAAAYNALGMAQYHQKKYRDAVKSLREAVRLMPEHARFRYNMAIAEMATRNKDGALSQYNVLKQSAPKLAARLYNAMFADQVVSVGP